GPRAREVRVHEADASDDGEAAGGQQAAVESLVQDSSGDEREAQLGHGRPEHGWAELGRIESAHGEGLRDDEGGGEQTETERKQSEREDQRVPWAQIRQIHEEIRAAQAVHRRAEQEEPPRRDESGKHTRPPPVEPLSMVKSRIEQRETSAGIEKSSETRFRSRGARPYSRRNAVVDANGHQRREDRGRPEHPCPRQMISVEPIE